MKPILFATNYTAASENAGQYAAQLARQLGTSLSVLHSWTVPAAVSDGIVVTPDPEELRRSEQLRVQKERDTLHEQWNIEVNGYEVNGFGPEEIIAHARKHNAGLIVMGTHHHNLISRMTGSVATALFHQSGFPILLIPEHYRFSEPKMILLAAGDDHEPTAQALSVLKTWNRFLHSRLAIVNVQKPEHIWNVQSTPDTLRLEHSLRFADHSWHYELNSSVTEGIKHAASETHADWIAVAPRHFSWLEGIFRRSTTGKLAFSCDKPLLILPAINN